MQNHSFGTFRRSGICEWNLTDSLACLHDPESWQNAGAIAASKATLTNFALELSKRMGLRYRSPPMPIDLTMKEAAPTDVVPPRDDASDDFDSVARMFDA